MTYQYKKLNANKTTQTQTLSSLTDFFLSFTVFIITNPLMLLAKWGKSKMLTPTSRNTVYMT